MKNLKRFLILAFLCCTLLPLSAFADAAEPLFEASVALQEGAVPTQFRVTQSAVSAPAFPDDPALAMEITPPDGESYTILFPSLEGYVGGPLAPLLRFEDMNGDGILDVNALFVMGASNVSSTYYLYDPADQHLHYAAPLGILSNAEYDPDRHIIFSQESDGVMRQFYFVFGLQDGQPVGLRSASLEVPCWSSRLRSASLEVLEEGEAFRIHTRVITATGDTLLNDLVPFDGSDSTIYNKQHEDMMQMLLEGVPADTGK